MTWDCIHFVIIVVVLVVIQTKNCFPVEILWLRVLQGRHPPSVQWPRVQESPRQTGSSKPLSPHKSSTPSATCQNPTQVSSDAAMRVSRLERCIAQFGPSDTAELKSSQVALTKARAQSILPHPAQQVEDCQGYCTRASRRLEKARAAVVAAQEAVVRFEAELQEGLQRLEATVNRNKFTSAAWSEGRVDGTTLTGMVGTTTAALS